MTERHVHLLGTTVPQVTLKFKCQQTNIISTNVGILSVGHLGTNFSETLMEIQTFSFKKMHWNMSSAKMAAILPRAQCVKLLSYQYFMGWVGL